VEKNDTAILLKEYLKKYQVYTIQKVVVFSQRYILMNKR